LQILFALDQIASYSRAHSNANSPACSSTRSRRAQATPAPPSSAERDIETTARAATILWEITSVSDSIVHVTDDSFEDEVLKSLEPVLVDYWADWCGPCKMIAPVLDEIAGEYAGRIKVAKLNIDENPNTPPRYGIRGIPTLMLFRQGEVEATKVGAVSKSQLTAFIDSNL
jgi:thioredoxin 1